MVKCKRPIHVKFLSGTARILQSNQIAEQLIIEFHEVYQDSPYACLRHNRKLITSSIDWLTLLGVRLGMATYNNLDFVENDIPGASLKGRQPNDLTLPDGCHAEVHRAVVERLIL